MGPMRHLPSPSGPGSLPGLMSKRRVFDDGSSDISSTPSSMMDYTGSLALAFCRLYFVCLDVFYVQFALNGWECIGKFLVILVGPRLYKQPTTKSNRSIMLNAVEYCVFPGAVNKEAKRRVVYKNGNVRFLLIQIVI